MKFTGKTLAEEEWKKIYGNWPSESDFAWPFFRDAFDAGNNTVKTENKPFYEILRSNLLLSPEISDSIILEFDSWLSKIYTNDGRISISSIRKKLKNK